MKLINMEYEVSAKMSGLCPDNTYADYYTTPWIVKALVKFIIFRFKYPQVVLSLGGRYVDCKDCKYICENYNED